MSLLGPVRRTSRTVQQLTMLALPHGGQQAARRNAWSAMAADSSRARARREADLAMTLAVAAAHRAGSARTAAAR